MRWGSWYRGSLLLAEGRVDEEARSEKQHGAEMNWEQFSMISPRLLGAGGRDGLKSRQGSCVASVNCLVGSGGPLKDFGGSETIRFASSQSSPWGLECGAGWGEGGSCDQILLGE